MNYFPVSNITNSTLNITLNTYSLQDALSLNNYDAAQSLNGDVAPYLFGTACQVDGGQNCTATCQDPELAFNTLETLHNCMMYPVIADQLFKDNLSPEIKDLAQALHIEKEQWPSPSVSLNISNTIWLCLDAYCSTLNGCTDEALQYNKSYYGEAYSEFPNQTTSFYFDFDDYLEDYGSANFDLCKYFPVSVNQDIGGIGVRHFKHRIAFCSLQSRYTYPIGSKRVSVFWRS